MSVRVLVADDERAVRESLRRALVVEGDDVELASGGREALASVGSGRADVVVLDVLMPDIDGLEVCRRLRSSGDRVPVLMLTARDAVSDRVEGLEAGADDYLVKPFDLDELIARLRALPRRAPRRIELTRTEFLLLELFMLNPRRVLSRSLIHERVWGYDFGPASNSLGVYVGYLRRKLEAEGEPRLIHTVRGVGYVLRSQ